jgi:hypothetical protein
MHARHMIAKSPLDISQLQISCHGGAVELTGIVKPPRDAKAMNVHKEFEVLKDLIRSTRGVKDVQASRVKVQES